MRTYATIVISRKPLRLAHGNRHEGHEGRETDERKLQITNYKFQMFGIASLGIGNLFAAEIGPFFELQPSA